MQAKRSAFGSAWVAFLLGFAALGLTALSFVAERAGVPVGILRFLMTVLVLGTVLIFGLFSLIVEDGRWQRAGRRVRGVSAVPGLALLAIGLAWALADRHAAASGVILLGGLSAFLLQLFVLGPRMRRLGATSPGRLIQQRFSDWESLPLRLIFGLVASAVLSGLLFRVLGILAEHFSAELGFGRSTGIVAAALLVFLPAWAGGTVALLRLARVVLAFGVAAVITALAVDRFLVGSAAAGLSLFPLQWDRSLIEPLLIGFCAALLTPALLPIVGSLSTPRSSYRTAGWLILLAVVVAAIIYMVGVPGMTDGDVEAATLTRSDLPPILVDIAGLAALVIAGGLLLLSLSICLIDDLILCLVAEEPLVQGRHLAWLRFAMIGATIALTAFMLIDPQQGRSWIALRDAALPLFVAIAIAGLIPALLWSRVSGIGTLTGVIVALLAQIALFLSGATILPFGSPEGGAYGVVAGLAGMIVTIAVSLLVSPRQDARHAAALMMETESTTALADEPRLLTNVTQPA
ncbi:hypothetical protein [Notoacmeibacter ruber]|uniref:Sodium:solute symporter n=1 Tax=Notoacmeibacter ruber TaxID=2670375 RepID=A0A3L7J9K7_9HYPH|nr:hypothetical protein [Notoacmeibacter ruber]RLQ87190.1 hypothetical protein D8780_02160 [Notoacmeibacter ruber]